MEISHIDEEKYLGKIINSVGKSTKHISKMRNKGIGLQNKVIQMLETMPGGKFYFVIAKILSNSLKKNRMGRGQTDRQTHTQKDRHTDFATTRPTRPRGPSW